MSAKSTTKKDIALLGNVSLAKILSANERQKMTPAKYPQHYPAVCKEYNLSAATGKI